MSNEDGESTSFVVQELHPISASMGNYVTIKVDRWHYYIDRSKLTLIDGGYRKKEELNEIERKCNIADRAVERGEPPSADCPEHFVLTIRWVDMVRLAEEILNLRDEREKAQR
jgi:hypothetical protein